MSDSANPAGYERSDVPPVVLLALAVGFALTVAIVMIVLAAAYPHSLNDDFKGPTQPLPPAPRLQTTPRSDLVAYQAAERRRLETYGWTDRAQGRVHEPVSQAMRQVAAQGWRSEGQ
ncbi:MAG TPA: hypothetical protein VH331_18675 [Allosphingosinicella sp.]|jgi:hypothetical protein|nr:hypothetical protein [Allosphingosinicella sp.]